jgi:hypothetical protein
MKKVSNDKDTYNVNDQVTVSVTNKRNEDMESGSVHYERTVTVKIKAGKYAEKPLTFDEPKSLIDFIEQVNFEDPQEVLPLDV